MSRESWNRIKQSKFFYIRNYRALLTLMLASLVLNVILCLLFFYAYINRPPIDFYATSGIAPPIELTPLDAPNTSDSALLPPDPTDEDINRVIPD